MAKINKEDVFEELEKLIDSLSKEKRDFQAEKLREIRENLSNCFIRMINIIMIL